MSRRRVTEATDEYVAVHRDDLHELRRRLAAVESAIEKLVALFLEDLDVDDRVHAVVRGPVVRRDKLPPAVVRRARQLHALKIRVVRAAKHHGIAYEEWVRLHGMRDRRFPDDVDPLVPTKERESQRRRRSRQAVKKGVPDEARNRDATVASVTG